MKDLYFLCYLAQKAGLHGTLETSTGKLAQDLDMSQQTVSRKLASFADDGFVQREVTSSGVAIRITEKGKSKLHHVYGELHGLFSQAITLSGTVRDGLGEGRFYMKQESYRTQFEQVLGFTPYEGTLNLAVHPRDVKTFLATKQLHYITGFATQERSFGGIKCYKVAVGNINAALIVPDRSVHSFDTIEIIAPQFLRDTLQLENGSTIEVR